MMTICARNDCDNEEFTAISWKIRINSCIIVLELKKPMGIY